MVSIYNENFTTPESRIPYFIEVHRCVLAGPDDDCKAALYPMANDTKDIEIVVPDLTNNDRNPAKKPKFYRYVVYNHTSCKCGSFAEFNSTMHKKIPYNTGECNLLHVTINIILNRSDQSFESNMKTDCDLRAVT